MDTRKIRKLIELVKETGVGELEVQSGDESVRIRCGGQVVAPAAQQIPVMHQPMAPQPMAPQVTAPQAAETTDNSSPVVEEGFKQCSPMVGTVYLAPTPGAKPFVAVGDRVEVGDPLCMVEAMKMFNKIEADRAGVISARLIENEQPVEYDQALFIIETNE